MLYQVALNPILRALADPTRRYLFERLCDQEDSVTRLAEPLPMSIPAVLQHLGVLERAGLIRTEKRQQLRWCRVEPEALRLIDRWLRDCRRDWERRHGSLKR